MGLQIDEAVHLVQPTTGPCCCPKKYITANALYSDRKEEERISGGEKMEERKVYQEQSESLKGTRNGSLVTLIAQENSLLTLFAAGNT